MRKKITLCACVSREFIDKKCVAEFAAAASMNGWDVNIAADMCAIAADEGENMLGLAEGVIAGCHERAMKSLMKWKCASPSMLLNMRCNDARTLLEQLQVDSVMPDADVLKEKVEYFENLIDSLPHQDVKDAWYPTIDKDVYKDYSIAHYQQCAMLFLCDNFCIGDWKLALL